MKYCIIFISVLLISCSEIKQVDIGVGEIGCKTEIQEKTIEGNSMFPLLSDGGRVLLEKDYYKKCSIIPQIGDIVAYDYGGKDIPLIKIIKVNDTQELLFSGNNLLVDSVIMKNSAGEEYSFSQAEKELLKLYIGENKKLPEKTYLMFGDNVDNSVDSRKFGAISQVDILGKFISQ